jgi:pyruvate/2-oxoglutarate dehydrogenase complex dihydrolipoamide dehydrogenase (E3) component
VSAAPDGGSPEGGSPDGGSPDGGSLEGDAFILATGAVPYMPPAMQPDGERVFSPHTIWEMKRLPESMIVIGAGGPATEYVDAFSRLGARITWITGPVGVLSAFPPEAGQTIAGLMEQRGVRILTGMMARAILRSPEGVQVEAGGRVYQAEAAFVAIGLRPDLERLHLPAAGLRPGSSGGLACDPWGRTAVPHIYLAGDAASPLSANISLAQGRLAGWHAAGREVEPLNLENGIMAIYTNPQVAVVGRMSDLEQPLRRVRAPFRACLRAHLALPAAGASMGLGAQHDPEGFLEMSYTAIPPRRITGALAVCPEAAEVIAPLAVAIRAGMTVEALASVYAAHPTFSELAFLAARMAR